MPLYPLKGVRVATQQGSKGNLKTGDGSSEQKGGPFDGGDGPKQQRLAGGENGCAFGRRENPGGAENSGRRGVVCGPFIAVVNRCASRASVSIVCYIASPCTQGTQVRCRTLPSIPGGLHNHRSDATPGILQDGVREIVPCG